MGLFSRQDPNKEAMKYLNQIPGQSHQTYDPYIQRGQQAGQGLDEQYGQMMNDPASFYDNLMKRYQPSQRYQMQNAEGQRVAGNAAAAGGMRGTAQDVGNAAQISQGLMANDMRDWYGNVSGLMGKGMAGQQHEADQGFDASRALGGDLMNTMGQQGGLAFQGAQGGNKDFNAILKMLMQGGGAALGGYMGGVPGAQAGAGIAGGASDWMTK